MVHKLKIVFENSADFFGRIIVYSLEVLGERGLWRCCSCPSEGERDLKSMRGCCGTEEHERCCRPPPNWCDWEPIMPFLVGRFFRWSPAFVTTRGKTQGLGSDFDFLLQLSYQMVVQFFYVHNVCLTVDMPFQIKIGTLKFWTRACSQSIGALHQAKEKCIFCKIILLVLQCLTLMYTNPNPVIEIRTYTS